MCSSDLAPAIVWQCRRTAAKCRELAEHAATITRKSGLVVDAYFSGTKLQWILRHVPGAMARARRGELAFAETYGRADKAGKVFVALDAPIAQQKAAAQEQGESAHVADLDRRMALKK